MIDQSWFEMRDIRRRFYAKAVWIPLRASQVLLKTGRFGYLGHREEFFGAGTLAVPVASKEQAGDALDWNAVGISHNHSGYIENGVYIPVQYFHDHQGRFEGEHLVLDQRGNSAEHHQWHLAQDLTIALGLKREGDTWVRPDEGYIDVVRLRRDSDGAPELLQIRGGHLRDYLVGLEEVVSIGKYSEKCCDC